MTYRQRILMLGILDAGIVTLAVITAYLLRFEFMVPAQYLRFLPYIIVVHSAIILIALNIANIYRRVWQYASIGELVSIIKAASIAEMAIFILDIFVFKFEVPRSIYPLSMVLIISGIGGSRFIWRMFRDTHLNNPKTNQRNLLIIGAGNAGALVARDLKSSSHSDLYPIGFIDDDKSKHGLEVMGLPVLGGRESISKVVLNYAIKDIVIAMPSAAKAEIAQIIETCKNTKASIKILPSVNDLVSGKVSVKMMREVSVEDLLGREPVMVNLNEIAGYVNGQVILVTGAGGSIGSELCRQIAQFGPKKLVLLGHGENSIYDIEHELRNSYPNVVLRPVIADVQDCQRISEVFRAYRPSVIFHAAAHKHVPLMEQNPAEAVKNNILGTRNVADCADKYGVSHFVMISTDKAVNPTSIMGATKRIAEMYVQGLDKISQTKFVAVRFGNVLGSRGSVIPLFKRQISQGGPVTVTHPEMIRYFMTIPEAVQLVIQAGAFAKGGEIFILDMGKPVKILDLARDLIRLSGFKLDEEIKIAFTGMRPGEKLYEEIMTNEEGTSATKHNRIFIGKPLDIAWKKLQLIISELDYVAKKADTVNRSQEIKELLHKIVPTYQGLSEEYKKQKIESASDLETVLDELKDGEAEVAAGWIN